MAELTVSVPSNNHSFFAIASILFDSPNIVYVHPPLRVPYTYPATLRFLFHYCNSTHFFNRSMYPIQSPSTTVACMMTSILVSHPLSYSNTSLAKSFVCPLPAQTVRYIRKSERNVKVISSIATALYFFIIVLPTVLFPVRESLFFSWLGVGRLRKPLFSSTMEPLFFRYGFVFSRKLHLLILLLIYFHN